MPSPLETPLYIPRRERSSVDRRINERSQKTKKKGYRNSLPANRCAFCKQETDTRRTCGECNEENFATCSKCVALGAPLIHAPRRMITVRSADDENYKMCFPQCARKAAYQCCKCSNWHDKTMLHKFRRREGQLRQSLCTTCADAYELEVCASCHSLTRRQEEYRDKCGYKCESCYSRGNSFETFEKDFKVITKSKNCRRTFGLELEINNVHKMSELSTLISKLNIDGVEFETKEDGSVHYGFEIVSLPAERPLLLKATKELCKLIRTFKHNYSGAGMHVHVKDQDADPVQVFKTWCAVEHFVFACLPRFRYENSYCRSLVDRIGDDDAIFSVTDQEEIIELQEDRYRALNIYSLDEHGTLEVRCHHATTNYRTIYHFINLLTGIWNRAKKGSMTMDEYKGLLALSKKCFYDNDAKSFNHISTFLSLPLVTKNYLRKQASFFHGNPGIDCSRVDLLSRWRIDNGSGDEVSIRRYNRINLPDIRSPFEIMDTTTNYVTTTNDSNTVFQTQRLNMEAIEEGWSNAMRSSEDIWRRGAVPAQAEGCYEVHISEGGGMYRYTHAIGRGSGMWSDSNAAQEAILRIVRQEISATPYAVLPIRINFV